MDSDRGNHYLLEERKEWIKDKESIVNSGSEGENVLEEFAASKCLKRT